LSSGAIWGSVTLTGTLSIKTEALNEFTLQAENISSLGQQFLLLGHPATEFSSMLY